MILLRRIVQFLSDLAFWLSTGLIVIVCVLALFALVVFTITVVRG